MIKHLLAGNDDSAIWSKRAQQQIAAVRKEFAWLDMEGTVVRLEKNGTAEWWTFAGTRVNATLAYEISQATKCRATYDSFTVTFEPHVSLNTIELALDKLQTLKVSEMSAKVEEHAIAGLKFSECLPYELALDMLKTRLCDHSAVRHTLGLSVRCISV